MVPGFFAKGWIDPLYLGPQSLDTGNLALSQSMREILRVAILPASNGIDESRDYLDKMNSAACRNHNAYYIL